MFYRIRATGDVLETQAATRRCRVGETVLTFGRAPVFIAASELPEVLRRDRYLQIEPVDSLPAGATVIDLTTPETPIPELKSERVQEDLTTPETPIPELKSERVQEELGAPETPPELWTRSDLKDPAAVSDAVQRVKKAAARRKH